MIHGNIRKHTSDRGRLLCFTWPNIVCGVCTGANKRCVQCKWATYCRKRCQTEDWREGHKKDCHMYISYRALVKATCKALHNMHVSLFLPFFEEKRDIVVIVTRAEPNVHQLKAEIRACMDNLKPDQHRNLRGESGSVVVIILPRFTMRPKARLQIEYKRTGYIWSPLTVLEV
jgi:hypothetical protein